MSTAPKIGQTTTQSELLGKRDAMHVPVVLARSGSYIQAGNWVKFTDYRCTEVVQTIRTEADGVVDPFLNDSVSPGDLFWVFLVPTIVGTVAHSFDIVKDGVKSPAPAPQHVADNQDKFEEIQQEISNLRALVEILRSSTPIYEEDDGCSMCYR